MDDQEDWSSNANEAITISIIRAGQTSLKTLSTFHPQFTYPIFGEEERIFGYQGLQILIRFAAHDLRPNIRITYDKKFKSVGETKAADIREVLSEWIPSSAFDKSENFDADVQNDTTAEDFRPPGQLIESYTSKDRNFEIWRGELTDPTVKELIRRIQIFVSFFIEGGTPLELADENWTQARWRVFFLYEKLPNSSNPQISSYSIVGYSTSYHFLSYNIPRPKPPVQTFTLPPIHPLDASSLPSRARISQFLILPSHQHHSHGTHLFESITRNFLSSPIITEITVEDPSEAFDDLRDYCDYTRLLANKTLSQITLNTSLAPALTSKRIGVRVPTSQLLDLPLLETLRRRNKLAPRQFYRLVELHLFSRIPPHTRQAGVARLTQRGKSSNDDDRAFYYWRLLVKQRVYRQNKDVLMQLERAERIDKVEQTVGELVGDYERLLRALEGKRGEGEGRRGRAKRKVVLDEADVDEDDDEGYEDSDAGNIGGIRESKRRKVVNEDDEDNEGDEDSDAGNIGGIREAKRRRVVED